MRHFKNIENIHYHTMHSCLFTFFASFMYVFFWKIWKDVINLMYKKPKYDQMFTRKLYLWRWFVRQDIILVQLHSIHSHNPFSCHCPLCNPCKIILSFNSNAFPDTQHSTFDWFRLINEYSTCNWIYSILYMLQFISFPYIHILLVLQLEFNQR